MADSRLVKYFLSYEASVLFFLNIGPSLTKILATQSVYHYSRGLFVAVRDMYVLALWFKAIIVFNSSKFSDMFLN